MIGQCAAPSAQSGLVRGLLETVDCNLREGVQGSYQAFFGPGSTLSAVMTILLTLYVALLGFRLLTGRTDLRVGDLPMIAIKLGAVVLLTTSWASYQTLVFALLFDGPAELANSLLASVPLNTGAGPSDIFARLQRTFDQLTQAASALALVDEGGGANASGIGLKGGGFVVQAAPGTDPKALQSITPVIQMRSALQGGPAFGATALWLSAVTMLVSTLGLLILAKLMLGLLLAVGPLFVGLLLFESTKGFFEGWLRTSLGFALVPLATVVFMTGLLASLEPSLAALEAARVAQRYALEPVLTVLVIVLTFTLVFASVMGLCTRLVSGFRLPDLKERPLDPLPTMTQINEADLARGAEQSRAARLAASLVPNDLRGGAMQTSDRRDARLASSVTANLGAGGSGSTTFDRRTEIVSGGSAGVSDGARADVSGRIGQVGRKRSQVASSSFSTAPGERLSLYPGSTNAKKAVTGRLA
jgi:type IV secretion system protein VirB6